MGLRYGKEYNTPMYNHNYFDVILSESPNSPSNRYGGIRDVSKGRTLAELDFDRWMFLAKTGDVVSQFNIAVCYSKGIGTKPSARNAITWYKRAADSNFEYAQANLGCHYLYGDIVEQNLPLAEEWLTLL